MDQQKFQRVFIKLKSYRIGEMIRDVRDDKFYFWYHKINYFKFFRSITDIFSIDFPLFNGILMELLGDLKTWWN